jgi:hypothetical protein
MTEPDHARIIQAGIDREFPGELFPTQIVEHQASVDVQVLEPQPAYEEAREVCRQWVESIVPSLSRKVRWTLAFLDGRDSIVAQSSKGEYYEGEVAWATQSISWRSHE